MALSVEFPLAYRDSLLPILTKPLPTPRLAFLAILSPRFACLFSFSFRFLRFGMD
jgi:hypothetical protein